VISLTDEEIEEIRKALREYSPWEGRDTTAWGNMARDRVELAIKDAGEILGRKIKTKSWNERRINGTDNRVDPVFETEEGELIVVEVKSTLGLGSILSRYGNAITSLKEDPGYIELIKKYGVVPKKGALSRKDIEAYIACVTCFHLDAKVLIIWVLEEVQ
jgi:hypothetical protein